jgi:hypothetical protein
LTEGNILALADQMKIETFVDGDDVRLAKDRQRPFRHVYMDAQFDTAKVYGFCSQNFLNAMHGSGTEGFWHTPKLGKKVRKFWSQRNWVDAPSRKARYFHWCGDKVKDTLAILRDGKGPAWETADDSSLDYRVQMMSEIKKDVLNKMTKRPEQRWVKIGSRPNHLWDCEAMQTCCAMIHRVLAMPGVTEEPEPAK